MSTQYFLISFCNTGVECIQNITDYMPENFVIRLAQARLEGSDQVPENPVFKQISHMTLRAMANAHRCYEIYTISVTDGITGECLWEWATSDAQGLADWVRQHHQYCHYSHKRLHSDKVVIV